MEADDWLWGSTEKEKEKMLLPQRLVSPFHPRHAAVPNLSQRFSKCSEFMVAEFISVTYFVLVCKE